MRTPDSPPSSIIDWIAASLRWLALLGMAISLALHAPLSIEMTAGLFVAAAWNVLLTTMAATQRRFTFHRLLIVASDAVVAYVLFYLSDTLGGSLGWAGLLPLISASLYYGYIGAAAVSLLNALIQGLLVWLGHSPLAAALFAVTLFPLYLGTGLFISYLQLRVTKLWYAGQKSTLPENHEIEGTEQERRRAVYNLLSALSASLNYQRVLDTAMEMTAPTLAAYNPAFDQLVSAAFLFRNSEAEGTVLYIASARSFTAADLRNSLPGTSGLLGRTIDQGNGQHTRELGKDPELARLISLHSCQSAYCIPLRTGMDTCGVLLFAHPKASFFAPETREILDLVGKQANVALENARLYQDLAQEKERMMEIQEEARKKMARDLHDGPTQTVAAIAMRVNFARRLMERDPKATAEELYKIEDLARRTTKEIRHMLFTLRPLVLESQGLIPALESMAEKTRETYNQKVIIQANPKFVEQLEMSKQGVIFYLAEEAVNNARKHAQAEHVWVTLKMVEDELALLEVADDGAGFDVNAVDAGYENRGSLGMVNMRERTELVNGRLQIHSVPGQGTRVQVIIPLSEAAADRLRRGP